MPKYARFDSTITEGPAPVLGWLDTDLVSYPSLPPDADLLEMTAEQWARRMKGCWAVEAGDLVSAPAPVPPAP